MIGDYRIKFGPAGWCAITFEESRSEYLLRTGIMRELREVLGTKGAILRVDNIEHEMSVHENPYVSLYVDIRKAPGNHPYINYEPNACLGRYFIKRSPGKVGIRSQWEIKLDGHIVGPAKLDNLRAVLGFGGELEEITVKPDPCSMYGATICFKFVKNRADEILNKINRNREREKMQFIYCNPSNSWAQSWLQTNVDICENSRLVDHIMDAFRFSAECLPRTMTANEARDALGIPKIEELSDKFIVKNIKEDNDMYRPSDEFCMKQLGIKEVCDLRIKKVIFNKPATIILWEDGTKTVVKCQKGDKYDKQKGFAFALMKKIYGSGFNDVIKYWCE